MRVSNKQIINDLDNLLQKEYPDNIKQVILFGSQTTAKATKNSDYDILVILKKPADWQMQRQISDLCYEIELKYNIITDTHIISEKEFSELRGKQPIFVNALEKGYKA
jgi:predicted nucleotidyltransferase